MSRIADIAVATLQWAFAAISQSADMAAALGVDQAEVADRIWDAPPPPQTPQPFVLLSVAEPRDVGGVGVTEVMARTELTAKIVGEAESFLALKGAAKALHAALQGQTGTPIPGGGDMLSSRRLRSIAYPETSNGIEYRHLGGTYEVFAQ